MSLTMTHVPRRDKALVKMLTVTLPEMGLTSDFTLEKSLIIIKTLTMFLHGAKQIIKSCKFEMESHVAAAGLLGLHILY